MGDPEEAPGSWRGIGSALAIAVTWGVINQVEDLLSPLCTSDFAIKEINLEKHYNSSITIECVSVCE